MKEKNGQFSCKKVREDNNFLGVISFEESLNSLVSTSKEFLFAYINLTVELKVKK